MQVAVADPAEDVRIAFARTFAAPVEEEDAVAVGRRACARASAGRSDLGKAITVAPLREGMNQPSSRRPSLVANATSSCAAPRFGVGTTARRMCVAKYPIETGIRKVGNQHETAARTRPRRGSGGGG